MKHRKSIIIVVLLAAVLTLVICFYLRPREPIYQGHTLTQWLTLSQSGEHKVTAQLAIREIGTNAIPFLLAKLKSGETQRHQELRKWLDRKSPIPIHLHDPLENYELAATGFEILREQGQPAAPTLVRWLKSAASQPPQDQSLADHVRPYCLLESLAAINPPKQILLSVLEEQFHNPDKTMQGMAWDICLKHFPDEAVKRGVTAGLYFPYTRPATATNSSQTTGLGGKP